MYLRTVLAQATGVEERTFLEPRHPAWSDPGFYARYVLSEKKFAHKQYLSSNPVIHYRRVENRGNLRYVAGQE
jgi:hypothetical protein